MTAVTAGRALWQRRGARSVVYRPLAIWFALGGLVLLVYTATPGASNNPRVLIPVLPPLCLLVADGLERFLPRWRTLAWGTCSAYLWQSTAWECSTRGCKRTLSPPRCRPGERCFWQYLSAAPIRYIVLPHDRLARRARLRHVLIPITLSGLSRFLAKVPWQPEELATTWHTRIAAQVQPLVAADTNEGPTAARAPVYGGSENRSR